LSGGRNNTPDRSKGRPIQPTWSTQGLTDRLYRAEHLLQRLPRLHILRAERIQLNLGERFMQIDMLSWLDKPGRQHAIDWRFNLKNRFIDL
jgi:hypothetical protein